MRWVRAGILAATAACATLLPSAGGAQSNTTATVDIGAENPAISPDGRSIAVSMLGKIWFVPIAGGEARQMTFGSDWDFQPAFSPDGRFLAFGRYHASASEVVLLNLATQATYTVWRSESPERFPALLPPLWEIEFHARRPQIWLLTSHGRYWHVDPFTRAAQAVEPAGRREPLSDNAFAFTPDGNGIVGNSFRNDTALFLHSFESGSTRPVLDSAAPRYLYDPRFAPDGKALLYLEKSEAQEKLLRTEWPSGSTREVLSGMYQNRELAVHPDGKTAVIAAARRLYRVDLRTGRTAPIPFRAAVPVPKRRTADLTIVNARVLDGTGAPVRAGMTVEVRNGRISRILPDQPSPDTPSRGDVVDAQGRFLMPGLVDNHAHTWKARTFALSDWLMRGITSVRDAGGQSQDNLNLRDALSRGLLQGPHLYSLSPIIDGEVARGRLKLTDADPGTTASLVRSLRDMGFDGIKLYSKLRPDVARAVINAAHTEKMPVLFHNGATTWQEAVAMGVDGLAHVQLYWVSETPSPGAGDGKTVEPDWNQLEALFRTMAAKGTMLDPTLLAASPALYRYPRYEELKKRHPDRDYEKEGAWAQEVLRRAVRAGVRLMAGTDEERDFTLLDELEAWEAAAIPNEKILEAATVNGALWLGRQHEFGTLEVGRRADMILIDGDPTKRIADLRRLSLVVHEGRVVLKR